jgi:hypothetical protein
MSRTFHMRFIFCLTTCVVLCACKPAADKKDERAEEAKAGESTNAEGGLKISAETQARMGLKVEAIAATEYTPETKVFGHVIDPTPLNAGINEMALARATMNLSQKELDRLKILRGQNNASERALQTAEAALEHDRLALQAATEKLQLTWGRELSRRKDLDQVVLRLAAGERSLLRLDLPVSEIPETVPQELQISLSGSNQRYDAEFLGRAPTLDLPTQGQGLLFLANVGNDQLPINGFVEAGFKTGAVGIKGFLIPASAVIAHEGEKWFYLQSDATQFYREPLQEFASMGKGYFVTNEVVAGGHVVTTGAQQLLSEELKSQIKAD